MKQINGIWIPTAEQYLERWLLADPNFAATYGDPFLAALPADRTGVAIDVGANVGLWTRLLAARFRQVYAYEPSPAPRRALVRNVEDFPNVTIRPVALGEKDGMATITENAPHETLLKTFIRPTGAGTVELTTIDREILIGPVDFIKIDCEGFDYYVLCGASETLRKFRPWVLFEDKREGRVAKGRYGRKVGAIQALLTDAGYELALEENENYLWRPL